MDKIIALCVLTHMGKIIENTKVSHSLGKCLGFIPKAWHYNLLIKVVTLIGFPHTTLLLHSSFFLRTVFHGKMWKGTLNCSNHNMRHKSPQRQCNKNIQHKTFIIIFPHVVTRNQNIRRPLSQGTCYNASTAITLFSHWCHI